MTGRLCINSDPVVHKQPTAEPGDDYDHVDPAEAKDVGAQNQSLGNLFTRGMSTMMGYVRLIPPLETHPSLPEGMHPANTSAHPHSKTAPQESRRQEDSEESLKDALKTVDEFRAKNKSLNARMSDMEKESKSKLLEKENEITDLLVQLEQIPEEERDQNYKAEITQKDSFIAKQQKRIEKLCEGKEDTSGMLAKSLGERERELEDKNRALLIEKSRVRSYKEKLEEAKKFETMFNDRSKEYTKLELEVDRLETELKKFKLDQNRPRVVKTDSFEDVSFDGSKQSVEPHLKVKAMEIVDLENQLTSCQQTIAEKEQQLTNLETHLEEARKIFTDVVKIKDHSKGQSHVIKETKQELDAIKMSHDELVEYKVSLEHQVEDTERHSRGLENDNQKLREELESMCRDRDVWEQSMKDARNSFEDQLSIVRVEADVYKEDFLHEREDREKAHTLMEKIRVEGETALHAKEIEMDELRHACNETVQKLSRKLEVTDEDLENVPLRSDTSTKESTSRNHQLHEEIERTQRDLKAAQEEMQAKTTQVKQYKKRNDQQEDKIVKLEEMNEQLSHEMERVRQKLEETKKVLETNFQEEKKSMNVEMDRVRRELEKEKKTVAHLTKAKRMSKGDIREEYSVLKAEHETLQEDYENLTKTSAQVEEQFSQLKISHLKLKQGKARPTSLTGGGGSKGAQASPQSTLTPTRTDAEKDSTASRKPMPLTCNEENHTIGTGNLESMCALNDRSIPKGSCCAAPLGTTHQGRATPHSDNRVPVPNLQPSLNPVSYQHHPNCEPYPTPAPDPQFNAEVQGTLRDGPVSQEAATLSSLNSLVLGSEQSVSYSREDEFQKQQRSNLRGNDHSEEQQYQQDEYSPQGQQYPSQGQQYPSQRQQREMQGQQHEMQRQQYPSQGQQYPSQRQQREMQEQQYPSQGQQYLSQGQQREMQGQQYPSQGQQREMQEQQYPSQGQQREMQGQQYPPQGQQREMQGQQYPPQGQQREMQGQQYPSQGQQHPSQGQQHEMQGQQYPSQGQQHPSQGQQREMQEQQYPSQGQQREMQGQQYPPQGQQREMQGQQYPSQGQQREMQGQQYPSQGQQHPSQGQQREMQGQQHPSQGQQREMQGQQYQMQGQQYASEGQQHPSQGQQHQMQRQQYQSEEQQYPSGQQYPLEGQQHPQYQPLHEIPQERNSDYQQQECEEPQSDHYNIPLAADFQHELTTPPIPKPRSNNRDQGDLGHLSHDLEKLSHDAEHSSHPIANVSCENRNPSDFNKELDPPLISHESAPVGTLPLQPEQFQSIPQSKVCLSSVDPSTNRDDHLDTKVLVEVNVLEKNIDKEMQEVRDEMSASISVGSYLDNAPLDPNLICPMCIKQFRIGEIQFFKAHVNKCDGTRT